MARKKITLTVSAMCPKGMKPAHFRRLIKDQINGGGGVYLSIGDQIEADTAIGKLHPSVSAARIVRD